MDEARQALGEPDSSWAVSASADDVKHSDATWEAFLRRFGVALNKSVKRDDGTSSDCLTE